MGNRFMSLLTGALYNKTPSDLRQDDFAIEPEITAKACLRNLRVYELPISYHGRTYAEGKKITWVDGLKAVWVLVSIRVRGR